MVITKTSLSHRHCKGSLGIGEEARPAQNAMTLPLAYFPGSKIEMKSLHTSRPFAGCCIYAESTWSAMWTLFSWCCIWGSLAPCNNGWGYLGNPDERSVWTSASACCISDSLAQYTGDHHNSAPLRRLEQSP
jgi:hypothetical protein